MTEQYLRRYTGKTVEVLVEGREGNYLHGLTGNYMRVHLEGPGDLRGELVKVKIEEVVEGRLLRGAVQSM